MTQYSSQFDEILGGLSPSDQNTLHVSQSGGIGNVIPKGSNDQKKRSLVPLPLNKVFKLWGRQKHANSKDSLNITVPRSTFPPKCSGSPSASCLDFSPEKYSLLPPFSPAQRDVKTECNVSLTSSTSSSDSRFPLVLESENTRLRSHKSLGTIAKKSLKSIYNSKFNSSVNYLHTSAETTLPNATPCRFSKEANRSSHSHRRKDDPKSLKGSLSPASSSKVSMHASPENVFRDQLPKLQAARPPALHASCFQPLSPKEIYCRGGPSFDFAGKFLETPTSKTFPHLPAKALVAQEGKEEKKAFPALAHNDITNSATIHPKKVASFGKRMPQSTMSEQFRPKTLDSKRSRSQDFPPTSRPVVALGPSATDQSKLHVQSHSYSGAVPSAPANALSDSLSTALSSNHHINPSPRHSSRPLYSRNSSKEAKLERSFKGVSPQPTDAEALVKFKRLLEAGLTKQGNGRGQDDGAAESSTEHCATTSHRRVISDSVAQNSHYDLSLQQSSSSSIETPGLSTPSVMDLVENTPPPLQQSSADDDFTTSTFESDVYDEIENVQLIVGSRLVCADPPLKGVIHDMQSPISSPRRDVQGHQGKSPIKTSNRRGRVFDNCLYDTSSTQKC